MLSVRIARGIIEAVGQSGFPHAQLLEAARLDRAALESADGYVAREDVYRLCEVAIDVTCDPALGLHWSERLCATTFNPLSHLIAHAENLRAAFEAMFEFHGLLTDARRFQLFESDDRVPSRIQTLDWNDAAGLSGRARSELSAYARP